LINVVVNRASDLWAIGCIIYQLMTGLPPFQSQTEFLIFRKIEKLEYSFHEGFNEDAKNLVQQLLVIEPQDRYFEMVYAIWRTQTE
jgi:3-phosphoinositide dependent protein kinase-1